MNTLAPALSITDKIRAGYELALKNNPTATVCPHCNGIGAVTLDVELGHFAFGKSFPCPCRERKQEAKPQTSAPQRSLPSKAKVVTQRAIPLDNPNAMNIDVAGVLKWAYDALTTELHGLVLGMTGAGKTNSMYVIIEEMLRAGGLVTIVDPEGDYRFLKTEFPVLIAGKGRKGNPIDLPVMPDAAAELARMLSGRGVSIILDLSGFNEEDKNLFVAEYVGELWRQYQDEDQPPMRLVIDEVQLFAPQNTQTASKKLILDIVSRGRKRHLTLLVATQRPQRADKTLLDGLDIRVLHRLKRGAAMNAVRDLLPYAVGKFEGKEIVNLFANMIRGQATFEMEGMQPVLVQIRPADTYHPGSAPVAIPLPFATVDAELIAELQGAMTGSAINNVIISREIADPPSPRLAELEAENKRLYDELDALRNVIVSRDEEIALLKLMQPVTPVIAEITTTSGTEIDGRSPLATARAVRKQQREFDQFIQALRSHQYSGSHRATLKFLIENDTNTYSINEVARFTGYSVSTLANNPPLRLIDMKFIWRQKGRKPMFCSLVRETLPKLYPDINTEGLIGQILKACR